MNCPACPSGVRRPGQYLCRVCWFTLPAAARRALNKADSAALTRLGALHEQLALGVPLAEIEVIP